MSEHVFRNPDIVQQLPFRDYIRENCPGASQGLSVLDLDLVPLLFGSIIGRPKNADGKFMLVEIKKAYAELNYAQARLLQMMHRLFRQADPEQRHYIGCYLLHWNYDTNEPAALNNDAISTELFKRWITGDLYIASLYDPVGYIPPSLFLPSQSQSNVSQVINPDRSEQ